VPPASPHSDPLVGVVATFIDARRLLVPRSAVVVGVSGGADSVAMLAVLRELAREDERAYRLTVAHLDHALREESAADAAFVADLAEQWSLPCICERRDVAAEARDRGEGLEQAGRTARYEFLRDAAAAAGADRVAVAHHADDNVETVLYRIVRGTHLRGAAGIPASRRLGRSPVTLIRPMLACRREEIEAFCRRAGLTWREDATNADTRLRRNFIRHELLPLLRERLNPRADEAVLRLAAAAAEAEGVLAELAAAALGRATREADEGCLVLDAAILAQEPPAVRACAVRQALEHLGAPMRSVGADRIAELAELPCGGGPSGVSLPGGYEARREAGEVILERSPVPPPAAEAIVLDLGGETILPDGRRIVCRTEVFDSAAFVRHCTDPPDGLEMLDADVVRGRLLCRPRRDGDAFVPLGCPGRQSVGDFLTNLHLPRRRREHVRCISDELGIVYVAPLRIDDRVRVTPRTQRVLQIRFGAESDAFC